MEFNFWTIVKILVGIYLTIGIIRFLFSCILMIFGNLIEGIMGCIVGGIGALLLKSYLIPTLPQWYIIVPVGALLGCIVNNIIKQGLGGYIKNNLYILWDLFVIAFLFTEGGSSNTSTKNQNRIDGKATSSGATEPAPKEATGACWHCLHLESNKYCRFGGKIKHPDMSTCPEFIHR